MIHVTKVGKNDKLMVGVCEDAKCGCEAECSIHDTRLAAIGQEMNVVRFIACPSCVGNIYVTEKPNA